MSVDILGDLVVAGTTKRGWGGEEIEAQRKGRVYVDEVSDRVQGTEDCLWNEAVRDGSDGERK